MKILVLGAGMYVTGRGGSGVGTVLASLVQASKQIEIESITVAAKSPGNKKIVADAVKRNNAKLGASLKAGFVSVDVAGPEFVRFLRANRFAAAIICLPDHMHFKAAQTLISQGIHCLMVKPLTPTLGEARRLVALQKKKKVYAAVEFHKRLDETNLFIKRALADKVLGDVLYFTVDYSQQIHIPVSTFKSWAGKTNIFQYLGVHYVDLIYFLTGYIPVRAMAYGTRNLLVSRGINTYDSIHAMVEWQDPRRKNKFFISNLNTNWIDPDNTSALSDQKYKVVGTKGRMECDQKNRGLELVQERLGTRQINPYFSEYLLDASGRMRFGGYGYKSILIFLADVQDLGLRVTDLTTLEKSRPSFTQALVSTAVIDVVTQSLKNQSQWKMIHGPF